MAQYAKDPNAVLDYKVDWASPDDGGPWLASGETITTSTWTRAETGSGMVVIDTSSNTTTTATVWLSGGTARSKVYKITNRIVTSAGRTDERTLNILVTDR